MYGAFVKDRSFWVQLAWGVALALLAGLGTLIFVVLMRLGLDLVWGWLKPSDVFPFLGNWLVVVIL